MFFHIEIYGARFDNGVERFWTWLRNYAQIVNSLVLFEVYKLYLSRDKQVQDSFPFSIGISSDEGPTNTLSNGILFPKGHLFPSVKILRLHRSNTFHMEAFYADQSELPSGLSPRISNFTVCVPLIPLLSFLILLKKISYWF